MAESRKKVPPDGGWGYMVILATAVSGFLMYPALQNFGLLFRPIFDELNMTGPEISSIISVNSGAGFVFGIFHGPLVKLFGYRLYAMIGSLLVAAGLLIASFSTKLWMFMVFYGILNSIGFSISHSAFSLSLNSYFVKRRTFAFGLAFMIAGVGSVIMPIVFSKAILFFGARGTAFITSGLLFNVFAAALLLQPVRWHYKYEGNSMEEGKELKPIEKNGNTPRIDQDAEDKLLKSEENDEKKPEEEVNAQKQENSGCWAIVVKLFDLDLLTDPILLSILIGLSFAFTGEIIFSMMYPIILGDKGFDLDDTAVIMSTTAGVDIIFRIIVPGVEKLLKWPTRDMYILTIVMLITSRFSLSLVSTYWNTMLVAGFLGVAKGFRTVYMNIVLANYVPIEKLPSAQGLQTLINGLILLALGPVVGLLRNHYGNFNVVVHLTNVMSLITLIIWILERIVVKIMSKSKKTSSTNR